MVKPVDQDGNYVIDSNDRIILGNKNPKWVLGWSNTFNYKGLELGIELNGRFGYMVDTGGEGQYGMYNQRKINYWTPDNTVLIIKSRFTVQQVAMLIQVC